MNDPEGQNGPVEVTGLEALYAAAMDCGVKMITAVAGFPTTAVIEHFEKNSPAEVTILWMTNEKAALETALGASVSGRRALTITKHVGMNVLSDPLITSVTHTIGAGLVIIAGDDPGVKASQNEQDSRWYGEVAEVAVFDPSNPDAAYRSLIRAFELSESTKTPVIVRITDRLEKATGPVTRSEDIKKTEATFDRSVWKLTMRGKHQHFHINVQPLLVDEAENTSLTLHVKAGKTGIISSGYPSLLVDELLSERQLEVSHLSLNVVSPLPVRKLRDFISDHKKVLVVEESEAFIESHINICENVLGKMSGHLPYGRIEKEQIGFAIENIDKDKVTKYTFIETIGERGSRSLCEDCLFLPVYRMLHDLDIFIAGDMGCSIRSASAPLEAVDVGFALGAAISTAAGFDKKSVAVIGDFGLSHSGIVGLINAVETKRDVLVMVLDNRTAAMTGGQSTPDLTEAVKALCDDATVFEFNDPELAGSRIKELEELVKDRLTVDGVSVIYVKADCVLYR
ncbi:thiamine pyrophosphate-dependent enzyme [Methanococcoides burtonii]|uniref:Indolepyruvate oxidoreductase subunit IorA n=1 Tax=Methanococcoides burtonii (strain DSM 6242 / NBRC 107633 / OCM 468 / ACE-M) TaxID=259564 RepID=Q12YG1_METBU|nr:thiamine pyrophosphate-dependent enzyme [Methanococcoides burtonii]ABE51515.1 Protein with C-terminal TPP-binding region [Methanococcoides burtonii DSM 6242]